VAVRLLRNEASQFVDFKGTATMVRLIELPRSPDWVEKVKEKAFQNMSQHESCAQSILVAFMEELGIEHPMVIRAVGAFHGGVVSSLTCGIHLAGAMVLGLLMGREKLQGGLDGLLPIVVPAQDLIKRLNKRLGSSSCKELTGVDFTDMEAAIQFYATGENQKCFSRVADGAEEIALFLQELEESGQLFRPE
jgi:C_GCAxxG_C_C family probable redox protein